MTKRLISVAVSASLLAVLAVAPSAQAHDRAAKRGHAVKHGWSHTRRKAYKPHVIRYHKDVQYFRRGYPDDCALLRRRARLTGNAYWRYATRRCVYDHYKPY